MECKDWFRNFNWPVERNEIISFRLFLETELEKFYKNCSDKFNKNIIKIVFNRLIIEYLSLFEVLLLLKRLKQEKNIPIYNKQHPKWSLVNDILDKGKPDNGIFEYKNISYSKKTILKNFLKSKKYYYKYNMYFNDYLNVFLPSQIINDIAESWNKKMNPIIINKWFPNKALYLKHFPVFYINELAKNLTNIINYCYSNHDIIISNSIYEYLFLLNQKFLEKTIKYYQWIRKNKISQLPNEIYSISGKNIYTRILGSIIQEQGGNLICCDHGEGHGIYRDTEEGYGELGVANKFIVYTSSMRELYQAGWSCMLKLQKKVPKFIVSPIGSGLETRKLLKKYRNYDDPQKINKILYVSGAFRNDFTHIECRLHDIVYLEWQYFLFQILNQKGYNVFCKYHPQTILNNKKFEPFDNVKYIYGNFIDLLDCADLYIFDYVQSTAFAIALCTNKPIILVYNSFPKLHEDVLRYLSKRCRIIKGYFDENNRFRVNKNELIEKINIKKSISYEYVYEYLTGNI